MTHRAKAVAVALMVAIAMSATPTPARAETIMGDCLDGAAVRANNCYMNADGSWFLEKLCDVRWDIDNVVCYVIGILTFFQ